MFTIESSPQVVLVLVIFFFFNDTATTEIYTLSLHDALPVTVEQGYQVAREVGLALLATIRASVGSLDRIKRVVKVLGMVNSAEGFGDQPRVVNGFSDLMVEVFGDAIGKHARSAVGMAELPMGIPVEIEMVLEVE